ncbi:Fc.00g073670.m01.CDS01 [Cosmosporella sp. VM-42]
MASFLILGQVIHSLPRPGKARMSLWIFALVSLVPYLANIVAIRAAQFSTPSFSQSQPHPVEVIIHNAKNDFETLIERQSKNYSAAYTEYRRRYSAEPPPGFQAWYEFAASHQSPIIDEFDIIYDKISPFWKLSGKEVYQVASDAGNLPGIDLWTCVFSGKSAKTHCSHPYRTFDRHLELLFENLLRDLPAILPDVRFLVNHLDEPRLLVPPSQGGRDDFTNELFNMTNMSNRPTWDAITKFCEPFPVRTGDKGNHVPNTYNLSFVADSYTAMDLCQHPEYRNMHGLFMSPTSFHLIEGFLPVLSTGSPSTMGDILFPSPAYIEPEFQYNPAFDVEWQKKRNNLYWAGSTTGGLALDDQWRYYHRQRFVKLAQNLERNHHNYLREKNGVVKLVASSFLNSRLFDVAFTRIFQCQRRFCREEKWFFNVKSWADKDQAFRSRLAFDIDGNGISGRYYKLLASRSLPLKQTVLKEWHDERLVPWVHYVPISQSLEEIPELVFYLTSTETGQRRAEEIADQGREWFSKAFREVDLSIYTYRLLLELARLQDPGRQAS